MYEQFTNQRDQVYPGVQGAYYWTEVYLSCPLFCVSLCASVFCAEIRGLDTATWNLLPVTCSNFYVSAAPSKRLTVLCCFCQDPWYNGPIRGYGRDEANSPGIALDTKRVQVYTCLFFFVFIFRSFLSASVLVSPGMTRNI